MKDKKSGILMAWLQNFTMMVFTQSFHAIIMLFTLKLMSEVSKQVANQGVASNITGLLAMISIGGAMAIIKFEKLLKEIFGFGTSKIMGGLGDNFSSSLMAAGSALGLAKRTAEPFKEYADAKKAINTKKFALNDKLRDKAGGEVYSTDRKNRGELTEAGRKYFNELGNTTINVTEEAPKVEGGNSQGSPVISAQGGNISVGDAGSVSLGSANAGPIQTPGNLNDLIKALNANTNAINNNGVGAEAGSLTPDQAILKERDEINKMEADFATNKKAMFAKMATRTASTAAAAGVALGSTDGIKDIATVTNLIDAPLDKVSDRVVNKTVYSNAAKRKQAELAQVENQIQETSTRIRNNLETEGVDTSEIEKEIAKQIKPLQNKKFELQGEISRVNIKTPDSVRKQVKDAGNDLASIWKDAQDYSMSKRSVRTRNNDLPKVAGTLEDAQD